MRRFVPRRPARGGATTATEGGPVTVTGRYRRRPGGWLLGALVLVPLLLALLSLPLAGAREKAAQNQAGQAASGGPTAQPVGEAIRVTTQDGRRVVSAGVPDEASKRTLLDGVRAASGDLRVVDEVEVTDGADAPPVAGIGTILAAGRGIPDLGVVLDRASLTLTGSAPDQASGTSTVFAAGQSYPGVRLVDRLQFPGGAAPAAAASPLTPECEQVRSTVAAGLEANPVKFDLGGATVQPASQQQLRGFGQQLSQCRFNSLEVAGHTDGTGSAAYNQRLSQKRAEAVRTVLVQSGVSADSVTAKGYGATKPVAADSTEAGRAANRRVEINAS